MCCDEESAASNGDKAGDFTAGQLFTKNERGERHNDDGAAVIQQRGDADANGLVGAEQEYPAGAQRGAREDKGRSFAGARRCLQLMALRSDEDDNERESTKKRAQEHDVGAWQCDGCGDDAVRSKQQ